MLHRVAAYLFPVPCVGCGTEGHMLCRPCSGAMRSAPRVHPVDGVGPVAAGLNYEGVARAAILVFKESGATTLASLLSEPFSRAVVAALAASELENPAAVCIVPVPSSRGARRRRGFQPIALLAARAGVRLSHVLGATQPHSTQKALGARARADNLAGVFRVQRPVTDMRVVVVDDVTTSGATLRAVAGVLRAAGATVSGAAVLAATPLRATPGDPFNASP